LRTVFCGLTLAAAAVLACAHAATMDLSSASEKLLADQSVATAPPAAFDTFLDRLMAAESGGRSTAKNPRSTALGPFQFIKGTFLELTRRHFPAEISGLSEKEILKLRTNPDLSRRAAAMFCRESVDYLKAKGLEPNFAHLRLAYLLGPADAARIMQAQEQTPVTSLLSSAVIKANPFMRKMSVTELIAKSERDVMRERTEPVAAPPAAPARIAGNAKASSRRRMPQATHARRCNAKPASCRKFSGRGASS
jgi:ribosomal protein L12E/L44/L45/RPP1/RPP2